MIDSAPTLTPPVGRRGHAQGPADAPVTLVEYGDYECPYCGAAHAIVKQLQARAGDRLRFVFRNFPLTQSHPHAQKAAEAAAAQGKFWETHDALYEHRDALAPEDLVGYAADLGLDVERFARDLEAGTYADRVRKDFMSGVRGGVNGAPTFVVGGRRLDAGYDLETLAAAIGVAGAASTRGD